MNNIHNLSIVIVTYRTDENILIDCLNSIDSKVNILFVEINHLQHFYNSQLKQLDIFFSLN